MLNEVTGQEFARLVVSDEPKAVKTLRKAVRDPHSCAIVAVQMVTEASTVPKSPPSPMRLTSPRTCSSPR